MNFLRLMEDRHFFSFTKMLICLCQVGRSEHAVYC